MNTVIPEPADLFVARVLHSLLHAPRFPVRIDLNFVPDNMRAPVLEKLVTAGFVVTWEHHKKAPALIETPDDFRSAMVFDDYWHVYPGQWSGTLLIEHRWGKS